MKQRFSSLDVKVMAHELSNNLVTLRLANVYDLSSKIFLLKFAKPDDKKQLVVDSGFRCHLTSFSRTTAAVPSSFVAKLRKFLKTRRVTSVAQIGTDRIIELQFSDGQYRIFLEFYAGGNIILTDKELNILALLRMVTEGEEQEELRVGRRYSLENRQNYGGIPPLTTERLKVALQRSVDNVAGGATGEKKQGRKSGDTLRKALAVSLTEYPPLLVDHSLRVTGFDATLKPFQVLENEALIDGLMHALDEAKRVVAEITKSQVTKGYIIAKKDVLAAGMEVSVTEGTKAARSDLKYHDFHPFKPRQFEEDPTCVILEFDGFNKTVDEFFSSIEDQRLESRLQERQFAAERKLEAAKQDQAKRLGGLVQVQEINERKAAAIVANIERVQETVDAVNSLIASGKDWVEIGKLIEFEQKRWNPVAVTIKLPLHLENNVITMLLEEEQLEPKDDDEANATDSDISDTEDASKIQLPKQSDGSALAIDINLGLSPWSNATAYHEQKRSAAVKEVKTAQALSMALKSQEQKITLDLKKGLKQEKATLRPVRQQLWVEKFIWFVSSDGYLVLGGRDSQQNEILYKRYLRKGDVYVHADLHGAASVVIRNKLTSDMPIPPSTLSQAGTLSVASSNAWDSKAGMSAWWVNADQVSKSAATGEFLPPGSFMVIGKKNFLPPAQLLLGFGVMFRISEDSKARHQKHRLQSDFVTVNDHPLPQNLLRKDSAEGSKIDMMDETSEHELEDDELHEVEEEDDEDRESIETGANSLESSEYNLKTRTEADSILDLEPLQNEAIPESLHRPMPEDSQTQDTLALEQVNEDEDDDSDASQNQRHLERLELNSKAKKGAAPLPRGKRSKAKKIAAKYRDQDEEDRIAAQTLIGATLGREKAEAEAKSKAEREAEIAFQKERRRAQHQRTMKETAEHEELRKAMLQGNVETFEEDSEKMTSLDDLVGTPLTGDEIIEAIPVCAPWAAMTTLKYKAKLQPGGQKKGKAVKEILDRWLSASTGKGVIDGESRDSEKMWPREVELLKSWRVEECLNCVPVGKVRVMMAGSLAGATTKDTAHKGRGGKGSKKHR